MTKMLNGKVARKAQVKSFGKLRRAAGMAVTAGFFVAGLLTADLGIWHARNAAAQEIADQAALAAAKELKIFEQEADLAVAATSQAIAFGLTDDDDIHVISPPSAGAFQGNPGAVEVVSDPAHPDYGGRFLDGGITCRRAGGRRRRKTPRAALGSRIAANSRQVTWQRPPRSLRADGRSQETME